MSEGCLYSNGLEPKVGEQVDVYGDLGGFVQGRALPQKGLPFAGPRWKVHDQQLS